MNIKALITMLVLGSSSAAMADSIKLSGSVKVTVGNTTRPAPIADRYDNRPNPGYQAPTYHAPVRPPVVVTHQPHTPVYRGPFYRPTNTTIGGDASSYKGWVANSPVKYRRMGDGSAVVFNRTATNSWFDLTEATRIDRGREFFTIGADNGVFKAIKLQGLGGGRSEINQVAIEYLDATGRAKTQKVVLDQSLSAGRPITIDLDGGYRTIGRIIVYGSTDRGSAYKILAM